MTPQTRNWSNVSFNQQKLILGSHFPDQPRWQPATCFFNEYCSVFNDFASLYVNYGIVAIVMTLSDFHSHSRTSSIFKCYFSYSCAAVDKISTEKACHKVPPR